jgi:hypothetical protein
LSGSEVADRIPLTKLIELYELSARLESDFEQRARVEQARDELTQRLHIQLVTFYTLGALYVLLFTAAFCIAVTSREELQKWSMSIVTLLAGALVGYLTGKQSR